MQKSKNYLLTGVLIAAAHTVCAQTIFNPLPSRIIGQPALQQSGVLTMTAPNLVEGRELWFPESLAVDTSVTPPILYVADTLNNRVLGWKNASAFQKGDYADLVIGQRDKFSTSGKGPGTDLTNGLFQPSGLAVDKKGNLYVGDAGNNRIIRYPAPFQQTGQLLAVDLILGQKDQTGRTANQGLSAGPTAVTLNLQSQFIGMTFDGAGNLWVADGGNNRVLRYPASVLGTGATFDPAADLVIGQPDFTSTTLPKEFTPINKDYLNGPGAIAFSPAGQLFVTDNSNRVVVFVSPSTNGQSAARVMGISTPTLSNPRPAAVSESTLFGPNGIFFVGDTPYVVDSGNNRILQYDPFSQWPLEPTTNPPAAGTAFSPPAKKVFGQPDFSSRLANAGQPQPTDISFAFPTSAVVVGNDLILADTGNNRVLAIPQVGGLFLHANRLLGQLDFKYNSLNLIEGRELDLSDIVHNQAGGGVAVDNVSAVPHLYVADVFNNRILGFKDVRTLQAGQVADLVIGQPDVFTAVLNFPTGNPQQVNDSGLEQPEGITVDSKGDLWVADSGNGRVLRFPRPFDQPPAQLPKANLVIGQSNFFTKVTDASSQNMKAPYGIAFTVDGHLVVSDTVQNRILLFRKPQGGDFVNGQIASNVLGQSDFITTFPTKLNGPRGIATDTSDRLYVADTGNSRIVVYGNLTLTGNDPPPSLLLTGSGGTDHFVNPVAVAVDPVTNEIWVADTFASPSRIVRFPQYDTLLLTPNSNYIVQDPSPVAIALDTAGNPVVAEGGANRVALYYRAIGTAGNAANYFSRFAPGMLATIKPSRNSSFGTDTVTNSTVPVPTTLGDVRVLVAGVPAPLVYVSPSQINFQIPSSTPVSSTVEIDVVRASTGQILAAWSVYRIDTYSPGLFTADSTGQGPLAVVNQDGTINSAAKPAKGGSVISLYGTGQGIIPGAPPDGVPASGLNPTPLTPRVFINAEEVTSTVSYSGLAPGAIGEWQINVQVPKDVPAGTTGGPATVSVVVVIGDANSSQDLISGGRITTTIKVIP